MGSGGGELTAGYTRWGLSGEGKVITGSLLGEALPFCLIRYHLCRFAQIMECSSFLFLAK